MKRSLNDMKLYYKGTREEVMHLVPDGGNRVLDVGCGAGVFAEELKRQGKAKEAWGIELNEEIAGYAAERLDKAFAGDALEIMPTLPAASFDLVTFTDVLEHLAYPGQALAQTKRLLAPGGHVVCSLPNIRYIHAMKRYVIHGEWPQEDNGIFDRTHLRFFTKKSIPLFFEENGYTIERMEGINEATGRKFRMMKAMARGRMDDTAFLQYAILARPS